MALKTSSIETVIHSTWTGKTKPAATRRKGGFDKARAWQTKCFKLLQDKKYATINAPTGSGKSWEMKVLAAAKMLQDGSLRTIIAVPQTIIGNGFLLANITIPGTKQNIHWEPAHNLCEDSATSNVDYVIEFLGKKTTAKTPLNDRILVCTHATLVALYKTLKAENRFKLLNNLVLWLDEAHHIKNATMVENENATISNGIGNLAKHLINSPKKNVHLGLATATVFRGDRCTLLTDEMEKKFTRFDLPYDEYLESMSHLKSFSFNFMLSGPDYIPAVAKLLKKKRCKDIIYFPHPESRHARGNKLKDVADLQAEIQKLHGKKIVETVEGVKIFSKGQKSYKSLDLVTEDGRAAKKAYTQQINQDADALDCIVAIGMFKEGANWVHANRSIIVGHRDSFVDMVQTIGRLFRDCPGKEHVEVINILPWSFDQADREKFRATLNEYLKAVYCLMILEDVLTPPDIIALDTKTPKKPTGQRAPDPIRIHIPDENKRIAIQGAVTEECMRIVDETAGQADLDDYVDAATTVCVKMGVVKKHAREVAHRFVLKNYKQTLRSQGVDVSKLDLDLLKSVNPVQWVVDFTTKHCNVSTFRDVRRALSESGKVYPSYEEAKRLTDEFFTQSGLPRTVANYQSWARGEFEGMSMPIKQAAVSPTPKATRRRPHRSDDIANASV